MSRASRKTAAAASNETITVDVQCIRCGYNLRGLTPEKVCPECGTPVGRSVHGNLLRYADPHWLGKLRLGAALMLWNILVGILLFFGAGALMTWGFPPIIDTVASSIAAALAWWAIFLVTAQEPRISRTEDTVTLRRFVRFFATANFMGFLVAGFGPYLGGGVVVLIAGVILQLANIIASFGQFVYFRRFARRMPNKKLAGSTTAVMWGFVVSLAAVSIAGTIGVLTGSFTLGGGVVTTAPVSTQPSAFSSVADDVVQLLVVFGGVGVVVFGIAYLILLIWYYRAFKKVSEQAHRLVRTGAPAEGRAAAAAPVIRLEDDPQIAEYKEALQQDPAAPAAHYNLAVVLAAKGFGAEAAKHYTEALRLDPGYLQARHNLANVLFKQGIVDQAVMHYTELLRLEPDFPTAHYNLANILLTQGQTDEAITHFTEAVRLRPDYAEARYYLGTTIEARGDAAQAVQEYRAVLQIDPHHAKARAKLDAAEDARPGSPP